MSEPKTERYAIVRDGKVENTCLWDGELYNAETRKGWNPPEGATMVKLERSPAHHYAEPGGKYDGKQFHPAPRPKAATKPKATKRKRRK